MAAELEIYVDLAGLVDEGEQKAKLEKDLKKIEKEIGIFEKKLSNKKFVDNAPAEVVEKNRVKLADFIAQAEKLRARL